jgi:Domain of unknown function (DUF4259)
MGARGEGAFDNDTAADWSGKFENADLAAGLQLITDALSAVAQADAAAYLCVDDGERAVAAAELVALINPCGEQSRDSQLTEPADRFRSSTLPLDLTLTASSGARPEAKPHSAAQDQGL